MLAAVFLSYVWTFGFSDRRPKALITGISAAGQSCSQAALLHGSPHLLSPLAPLGCWEMVPVWDPWGERSPFPGLRGQVLRQGLILVQAGLELGSSYLRRTSLLSARFTDVSLWVCFSFEPPGTPRRVEKGIAATLCTIPSTWKHELRSHCRPGWPRTCDTDQASPELFSSS